MTRLHDFSLEKLCADSTGVVLKNVDSCRYAVDPERERKRCYESSSADERRDPKYDDSVPPQRLDLNDRRPASASIDRPRRVDYGRCSTIVIWASSAASRSATSRDESI